MRSDSHSAFKVLRKLAAKLSDTPVHPQWFAFYREARNLRLGCRDLNGTVVDIGCADARPRQYLPATASYVGVDYPSTAKEWYATRPDLYADARALPIADGRIDHVLLLDVLEHVAHPVTALREIHRVLRVGGSLTIQVPFLYPIHDAPLDFHRWTRFGLQQAAADCGFRIDKEAAIGHPVESAALNANIALSKTVLNWLRQRNPLAVLGLLVPPLVLLNNLTAWLVAKVSPQDNMMPYAYRMIWIKA